MPLISEARAVLFVPTSSELGSRRFRAGSSYPSKGPLLMAASRTEEKKLARKIFANILIVANFPDVPESVAGAGDFLQASAFTSSD